MSLNCQSINAKFDDLQLFINRSNERQARVQGGGGARGPTPPPPPPLEIEKQKKSHQGKF